MNKTPPTKRPMHIKARLICQKHQRRSIVLQPVYSQLSHQHTRSDRRFGNVHVIVVKMELTCWSTQVCSVQLQLNHNQLNHNASHPTFRVNWRCAPSVNVVSTRFTKSKISTGVDQKFLMFDMSKQVARNHVVSAFFFIKILKT